MTLMNALFGDSGELLSLRIVTRVTETFGPCWQCHGTGYVQNDHSTTPPQCLRCNGTGQIVTSRTTETEQ